MSDFRRRLGSAAAARAAHHAGPKTKDHAIVARCGARFTRSTAFASTSLAIKGGQLARLAYPATLLTLVLSDVIGDDLDVIGSGPTVPDRSTFADARAIFEKYGIWENCRPRCANA